MKLLSAESLRTLEQATSRYEESLTPDLVSYLAGRGITEETAREFRLGSVVDPMPGHEIGAGMLAVPYIKRDGLVASIRFRQPHDCDSLGCQHSKYFYPPGTEPHLYNSNALDAPAPFVGLTEGEFDALILSAYCGIPSVGVPGVRQWGKRQEWHRLFDDREVLLFPDLDASGVGDELVHAVTASLDNVRVIKPPALRDGEKKMDVNLWFLREGADAIREKARILVGRLLDDSFDAKQDGANLCNTPKTVKDVPTENTLITVAIEIPGPMDPEVLQLAAAGIGRLLGAVGGSGKLTDISLYTRSPARSV